MKNITISVREAESLLGYISELIEAIDVENEEIGNFIDEGYTDFVQPLVDLVEAAKKEPNENNSKWAEVLNDFADLEEGKSYIDAWLTDDPNEDGQVIAKIDIKTLEVEYLDEDAKTDPYAQDIIAEAIEMLKANGY